MSDWLNDYPWRSDVSDQERIIDSNGARKIRFFAERKNIAEAREYGKQIGREQGYKDGFWSGVICGAAAATLAAIVIMAIVGKIAG